MAAHKTFRLLAWLLAPLLGGCATMNYYWQAIDGHIQLLRSAQPIDKLIGDPGTEPTLRTRLEHMREIREFSTRELGLPDNGSYRKYAALGRPYVVWNVFATPELSIRLKQWCFPVAGCVAYRGYFSRDQAEAFAAGLRSQGYDAVVFGVPAYSTLGWFDDPLLSTMLRYPDTEVARMVFHELAHQVVYVGDDSVFNESFATTVEMEGMRRWLETAATPAQRESYQRAQQHKQEFVSLMLRYRARLEAAYDSSGDIREKRDAKARILGELAEDYSQLKALWGGYAGYDERIGTAPGNAHVASIAAYTQWVPAFQALMARTHGDLRTFYAAARDIARLPKAQRNDRLAELGQSGIDVGYAQKYGNSLGGG